MDGIESEINTYGLTCFPEGSTQSIIELKCFRWQRDCGSKIPGLLPAHEHALNAIRLIWPEGVDLEATCPVNGKTYENFFLTDTMEQLCAEKELTLTGAASTGKTFPVAIDCLLCFYAEPHRTTILCSTTSASGADGRIWSTIKDLHNKATFNVGTPLEYLKTIVFDPKQEISGTRDASQRDLRNALLVVPIGRGAEGRAATRAIIGRKNYYVMWVVDELPEMDDGILEDTIANLENNPSFEFRGLGNASRRIDPHGLMCEPEGGWGTEDISGERYGGKWRTKRGGVCMFLDGHRSPNMADELLDIENKNDLPFPYLSNRIGHDRNARRYGHGDIQAGRRTLPYLRMSRGIWPDSSVEATVLSRATVEEHAATERPAFDYNTVTTFCGCDPAFSAGGDAFKLMFARLGTDWQNNQTLILDEHATTLHPDAGEEYRQQMARRVVETCKARGVQPHQFGIDVSNDGGIIAQAIMREWGSTDIVLLSSQGKADDDRIVSEIDSRSAREAYDRKVTQYWFQIQTGILTNQIKGFNINSDYASDLFNRLYEHKSQDMISIEPKRELKQRINRSPDAGDALSYVVEMAIRGGLTFTNALNNEPAIRDADTMDIYAKAQANAMGLAGDDLFDSDGFDEGEFEYGF